MNKKMKAKLRAATNRFVRKHGNATEIADRLTAALLADDGPRTCKTTYNRGKPGITGQAVHNWMVRGKIPHKRLAVIEQVYGVKPEELRPDRDWLLTTGESE